MQVSSGQAGACSFSPWCSRISSSSLPPELAATSIARCMPLVSSIRYIPDLFIPGCGQQPSPACLNAVHCLLSLQQPSCRLSCPSCLLSRTLAIPHRFFGKFWSILLPWAWISPVADFLVAFHTSNQLGEATSMVAATSGSIYLAFKPTFAPVINSIQKGFEYSHTHASVEQSHRQTGPAEHHQVVVDSGLPFSSRTEGLSWTLPTSSPLCNLGRICQA